MSWVKSFFSLLTPAIKSVLDDIKVTVEEVLHISEQRLNKLFKSLAKLTALFFMCTIGILFMLIGLAQFLDKLFELVPGAGLMIIGGVLVLLALFAWVMRD